jgi:mannan endo-1,4-beta-mannosidase
MKLLVLLLISLSAYTNEFVSVKGTKFILNNRPYTFMGTNFWYALNLGSKGKGGDRERLKRELDKLKSLKVNNLRIMAATEGPNDIPYRVVPAMQIAPGQYDMKVVDGLDFLLFEMGKRQMKAVMVLNNFWNWSWRWRWW